MGARFEGVTPSTGHQINNTFHASVSSAPERFSICGCDEAGAHATLKT